MCEFKCGVSLDDFAIANHLMKNFGCSHRILADSTVKRNGKRFFQKITKYQALQTKKLLSPARIVKMQNHQVSEDGRKIRNT